jgi:DNA-directed RNA polymerase subunit beta'
MLYGIYYLTVEIPGEKGEGKTFSSPDEAILAYETGNCSLHSKVTVRVSKEIDGVVYQKRIETTVGRIIFNRVMPLGLGFTKRETPLDMLDNEVEFAVNKKQMKKIIKACYVNLGATRTAVMLDAIKELGYKYSTIASLTANLFDIRVAKDRVEIIADADNQAINVAKDFRRGMITKEDQSRLLL